MQLFYHPDIQSIDTQLTFPRDESKHIVKVLRKREGDVLHITNGKGSVFETQIIHADPNKCQVKIDKLTTSDPPRPRLHLMVAPTKMNDRYEWFLEKATEIGVQHITPVICEHSERTIIKKDRFQRVLQSAMKQSLHAYLPLLEEQKDFFQVVSLPFDGQKFIAHCESDKERKQLNKVMKKDEDAIIMIGPEGDFSSQEIAQALDHGWIPVSLGNSRLRTETAAVVACHTFALVNQ